MYNYCINDKTLLDLYNQLWYNNHVGFDERYTMGAMKDLWEQINYYLDKTKWSCQEIADYLEIPVSWVNEVVEERWNEVISESD